MIAAGQRLAFDVVGVAGGWLPTTVDEVRSGAVAELSSAFRVRNLVVENTAEMYEMLEWSFLARVEVEPIQGFATIEDAQSVVAHAFYEVTGNLPSVTDAGEGSAPTSGGGLGDWLSGLGDRVGSVLGGLQDSTNLLLVLTAGVLIALVVSAGGKTTRIGLG